MIELFMPALTTFTSNLPNAIALATGAGLFRGFSGYLEECLRNDGKLDKFEITKLGKTLVQYISAVTLLSFGVSVEVAVAMVYALDLSKGKLRRAITPAKKK